MKGLEIGLLILYGLGLLFILCYSIIQIYLVIKYNQRKKDGQKAWSPLLKFPKVTVQLPLYNELYVVERLIESVLKFDYPKELLEVQILDDSTDETTQIVADTVAPYLLQGFKIEHIRREDRSGFKAGALAIGMEKAQGEFIAIFDADFLPHPDFLQKMILPFQDEKVGCVQSRWQHINADFSLLTKLQAFGLDAHFSVEQGGRNKAGHFINFNGTAGVWRKATIEDAGGWQSDTLTEDLDLSYRAQLKGWQFVYREDVGAPAELPAEMNALKTQQFRWTKGAAECARKNLGKVLVAKNLGLGTKLNAIFHLMNSAVFVSIVLISVLSLPMLFIKQSNDSYAWLFKLGSIFMLTLPILAIFYWTSIINQYEKKSIAFKHFILLFPLFLSVSMGLSLHNALAVVEGYIGKKTPFIRTPKFNLSNNKKESWKTNVYLTRSIGLLTVLELVLVVYFLVAIYFGFHFEDYGLMPFHLLLVFGFGFVSLKSIFHLFKINRLT
jgi:cellulose synthase/poly-beta-1,6-N-acetylglucosamine synthase-like glycosyltransferase